MTTDRFTMYEKDFQKRITALEKSSLVDQYSASNEMQELNDILEKMRGEAQEVPLYKAKLRAHEARLASLQSETSSNNSSDRGIGHARSDHSKDDDDQIRRQRLLNNTERLHCSSQRLQDSHRLALETETMGANILQQLRTQRETLTRSQDAVSESDSYLDKASKTLKSMSRR